MALIDPQLGTQSQQVIFKRPYTYGVIKGSVDTPVGLEGKYDDWEVAVLEKCNWAQFPQQA